MELNELNVTTQRSERYTQKRHQTRQQKQEHTSIVTIFG